MKQETNSTQENTKDSNSKHIANISIIYFIAFLILLIGFVCYGQETGSQSSDLELSALKLKVGSETQPLFTIDLTKAQANYKKEALRYMLRQGVYYESPSLSSLFTETSQSRILPVKQFVNQTHIENTVISEIVKFNLTGSLSALKNNETNFLKFNPHVNISLTLLKINF